MTPDHGDGINSHLPAAGLAVAAKHAIMIEMFRFGFVNLASVISLACVLAAVQLNDTDGVSHAPFDLHKQKAAVLIFVGVDCPISNSYAPEINRIVKDYAGNGFDFFIVYSDPALSVADAKKHTKDYGYQCPALMDSDQVLMKQAKATVTPQAVVMDASGQSLYSGRIDNWYEDFGKQRYAPTTHDLRDALDAIAAGKKVATPVTKVVGCPI
jgi:hypothetical protein